jgi:multiple sugar transport system permease protein
VFALAIAMLLNKGIRGLSLYRAVYYVPSLLGGSVAIALLWRQVFGRNGIVNQLLNSVGVSDPPSWMAHPDYALYPLIILAIWQFGSPMLIFLAGLKQIPEDLYEAASIDGAGAISKFFRITVPLITPVIFFNVVLQMIGAFQVFTPAYIMGGGTGGPRDSMLFYTLYLYQQGFVNMSMGYAAAMAWVLLGIIAAFTAVNFFLSRYWVFYQDAG